MIHVCAVFRLLSRLLLCHLTFYLLFFLTNSGNALPLIECTGTETETAPKFTCRRFQVWFWSKEGYWKDFQKKAVLGIGWTWIRISMLKPIKIRIRIGINMILILMRTLFPSFLHVWKSRQIRPLGFFSGQLLKNPKLKILYWISDGLITIPVPYQCWGGVANSSGGGGRFLRCKG